MGMLKLGYDELFGQQLEMVYAWTNVCSISTWTKQLLHCLYSHLSYVRGNFSGQ